MPSGAKNDAERAQSVQLSRPKSWTKWTPKTPELRQFFRGYSTAERIVARDCEKFHNVYGRRAGVYNYLERMCNCCTLTIYNNSGACAVS